MFCILKWSPSPEPHSIKHDCGAGEPTYCLALVKHPTKQDGLHDTVTGSNAYMTTSRPCSVLWSNDCHLPALLPWATGCMGRRPPVAAGAARFEPRLWLQTAYATVANSAVAAAAEDHLLLTVRKGARRAPSRCNPRVAICTRIPFEQTLTSLLGSLLPCAESLQLS